MTNNTQPKGSKENPYSYSEYEALDNAGTWQGGFVDMGNGGEPVYIMREFAVNGYGSGYSGYYGSSFQFGSYKTFSSGEIEEDNDDDEDYNTDDFDNGNNNSNTNGDGSNPGSGGSGHHDLIIYETQLILSYLTNALTEIRNCLPGNVHDEIIQLVQSGKLILIRDAIGNYVQDSDLIRLGIPNDGSWISGGSVIHEYIHKIQNEIGNLDAKNSRLNNEYQAYLISNLLTHLGTDGNYNTTGMSDEEYQSFRNMASIHITLSSPMGAIVTTDYIHYLNGLSWDNYVSEFQIYMYNTYGRETINSNYNWKWDELFERLGYTVVETSSE